MKNTSNIFALLMILGLVLTGCTDALVAPEEYAPGFQAKAQNQIRKADAKLRRNLTSRRIRKDEVVYDIVYSVENDGPDAATGVQVEFRSYSSCAPAGEFQDRYFVWEIQDEILSGESAFIEISCSLDELLDMQGVAEIMYSDTFDPDSVPDNNNPEEDDQIDLLVDASEIEEL